MEKVIVGLIRGRHPLPVDQYLFDEIKDVFDFHAMESHILEFLSANVGIRETYGAGINQTDGTDVVIVSGIKELVCYVTGLTSVTAALVSCCAMNGVPLTLMHYDAETGEYRSQSVLR